MSKDENNKARDDKNQAHMKFEKGVVTKQQGVAWTTSPSVGTPPNTSGRSWEDQACKGRQALQRSNNQHRDPDAYPREKYPKCLLELVMLQLALNSCSFYSCCHLGYRQKGCNSVYLNSAEDKGSGKTDSLVQIVLSIYQDGGLCLQSQLLIIKSNHSNTHTSSKKVCVLRKICLSSVSSKKLFMSASQFALLSFISFSNCSN